MNANEMWEMYIKHFPKESANEHAMLLAKQSFYAGLYSVLSEIRSIGRLPPKQAAAKMADLNVEVRYWCEELYATYKARTN